MKRFRIAAVLLAVMLSLGAGVVYWLNHRLPFDFGSVNRIEVVGGNGKRVMVTDQHTIRRIFSLMKFSCPYGVEAGGLEWIRLRAFAGEQELPTIWSGDYTEWGYGGKVKGFSNELDHLLRELLKDN